MESDQFVWGVATSSYQIEGAANEDGRGPSIWDTFSKTPGKVSDGSNGDVACDHYHRYAADVDLLADLGVNAYRFSIAWPRIFPNGTGQPNQAGIDFYRRLLDKLEERDVAAFATLYHWDLPQALEDEGGWRSRQTAYAFADYAGAMVDALGDRVAAWATLNEPWCSSYLGYGVGIHAPGAKDMSSAFRAAHHLNLGHGLAIERMRAGGANKLGIVLNLAPVRVVSDFPGADEAARTQHVWRNDIWLDPILDGEYGPAVLKVAERDGGRLAIEEGDLDIIAGRLDWMGINYYFDVQLPEPPPGPRTDMGWAITPHGMYDVIKLVWDRKHLPLYITENGAAFSDPDDGSLIDQDRVAFLDAYISEVFRAIQDGIDVRGYFLWSFLDNFEWAEGYLKRFGIVHVDFATQTRTPRESYRWYQRFIAHQRDELSDKR